MSELFRKVLNNTLFTQYFRQDEKDILQTYRQNHAEYFDHSSDGTEESICELVVMEWPDRRSSHLNSSRSWADLSSIWTLVSGKIFFIEVNV